MQEAFKKLIDALAYVRNAWQSLEKGQIFRNVLHVASKDEEEEEEEN